MLQSSQQQPHLEHTVTTLKKQHKLLSMLLGVLSLCAMQGTTEYNDCHPQELSMYVTHLHAWQGMQIPV